MPFLNTAFIEYMVLQADKGYDIIVPAPLDGLQPLHAIYARRSLPDIRSRLDRNRLQIKGFYPGRRILEISPETLHTFDPEERMFLNVNTPEDLQKLSSVRGTDEKGGSHALRV